MDNLFLSIDIRTVWGYARYPVRKRLRHTTDRKPLIGQSREVRVNFRFQIRKPLWAVDFK